MSNIKYSKQTWAYDEGSGKRSNMRLHIDSRADADPDGFADSGEPFKGQSRDYGGSLTVKFVRTDVGELKLVSGDETKWCPYPGCEHGKISRKLSGEYSQRVNCPKKCRYGRVKAD